MGEIRVAMFLQMMAGGSHLCQMLSFASFAIPFLFFPMTCFVISKKGTKRCAQCGPRSKFLFVAVTTVKFGWSRKHQITKIFRLMSPKGRKSL